MTTMPAAMLALVDVCSAALPDARVDDGPTVEPYEQDEDGWSTGVTVGWQEDGPGVAATLDREMSDGMGSDVETYTIYSTLFKSYGDEAAPPLREAAFADYAAVKAKLRERRPLTPGVLRARVTVVDYEVRSVETGWEGRLRFAVEIEAFDRN